MLANRHLRVSRKINMYLYYYSFSFQKLLKHGPSNERGSGTNRKFYVENFKLNYRSVKQIVYGFGEVKEINPLLIWLKPAYKIVTRVF